MQVVRSLLLFFGRILSLLPCSPPRLSVTTDSTVDFKLKLLVNIQKAYVDPCNDLNLLGKREVWSTWFWYVMMVRLWLPDKESKFELARDRASNVCESWSSLMFNWLIWNTYMFDTYPGDICYERFSHHVYFNTKSTRHVKKKKLSNTP